MKAAAIVEHAASDACVAELERQIPAAADLASKTQRTVRTCLAELCQLSEPQYTAALARVFEYPFGTGSDMEGLVADFSALPFAECQSRKVIFGRKSDGARTLLLSDPFDEDSEGWAMRRLEESTTGEWSTMLVSRANVDALLAVYEAHRRAVDEYEEGGSTSDLSTDDDIPVISLSSIGDVQSDVVRLVDSTIYDALKIKASDIHLECDLAGLHVQFRVDGVLVPVTSIAGIERANQAISRVKVMAELDIAERRIPQDGRFRVRVDRRDVDFRVSIMPNAFGEDAVLRLLDRRSLTEDVAGALTLESLGLNDNGIANIRELAQRPHGMLLVTGPTGSGKTTTLYAAITEIHTGRDKIVTIEDPVEYRLPRVLQIPVNEKKGLTFARGLRSILRHDPDKIMVGEIRDSDTAQIAVQAALTGHLVFTTVHANSVFDVLGRFLHMGVDAYSFAAALNGIVSQRLLRVNCESCVALRRPDESAIQRAKLQSADLRSWKLMAGAGCANCRGTGFLGRRAIAEVLVLDDRLREAIATRAPVSVLREMAASVGMQTMRECALDVVRQGDTTLEEFLRVAG
ncbi:GspE/PulE family protein [Piscinibacter sp. HJYY11]|uniref:GspE/PulE family protein n=1 Tax=Piscinibacter sp. HJYY11 TaxID=2801333 RepID=UPI00191F2B3F|nr:GspE/PulE family protein [Piscinibacter sp. HJYY11]MBL0729594.1 type II/IV secretion system protein [Piscinibacter sp. HJYY11]